PARDAAVPGSPDTVGSARARRRRLRPPPVHQPMAPHRSRRAGDDRLGDGRHRRRRHGRPQRRRALRRRTPTCLARDVPRPAHRGAPARRAHHVSRSALPAGTPRPAPRPRPRRARGHRRRAARPRPGRRDRGPGRTARPGAHPRRRHSGGRTDLRAALGRLRHRHRRGRGPCHRQAHDPPVEPARSRPHHLTGRPRPSPYTPRTPMRRSLLALPAVLVITLITACGTTEPPASGEQDDGGGRSGEPVTVTDDRGETIELDGPAQDVVGLEWGLVENLVARGVMPTGVADVEGFRTWDTAVDLEDSVTDVGTRGEPSVDQIIELDPDLVVTTSDLPETIIGQLEDVGLPVLVLHGSDAADPLGHIDHTVEVLAQATGTVEEGEQLLADLDATIQDGRARLAAAGLDGAPFAMADGWQDGGSVSIRMFTDGAMLTALGEELGLRNAW